ASHEELGQLLPHALAKAGNASRMTAELHDTLVDHAAGNYRVLMTMSAELLAYGMAHEVQQLDEKFYLEVFQAKLPRPAAKKKAAVKMPAVDDQLLPVVRVGDIPHQDQAQRWLVEHLWGESSVGVIGGAPKCSKTW